MDPCSISGVNHFFSVTITQLDLFLYALPSISEAIFLVPLSVNLLGLVIRGRSREEAPGGDYWSQHGRWQGGASGSRELRGREGYFANLYCL